MTLAFANRSCVRFVTLRRHYKSHLDILFHLLRFAYVQNFSLWTVPAVFDDCLALFMSPRCPMVDQDLLAVARFNLWTEIEQIMTLWYYVCNFRPISLIIT